MVSAPKSSKWLIRWLVVSIFIQQTSAQTCFAIQNDTQSYQRARFYDATTGRFNRLDPFAGNQNDPQSFHKYAYVHGDPIQNIDPTGQFSIGQIALAVGVGSGLTSGYLTYANGGTALQIIGAAALGFGIGTGAVLASGPLFAVTTITAGLTGTALISAVAAIGTFAYYRGLLTGIPVDPAPPSTQAAWTSQSLLNHIDTIQLPAGANQNDRQVAKSHLQSLWSTYSDFRDNGVPLEQAVHGQACHFFCTSVLREWQDNSPRNSSATYRKFFKVYKTTYNRSDGIEYSDNDGYRPLEQNTHGTILIEFADGRRAHLDNGWFARTGGFSDDVRAYGDTNIPSNYWLAESEIY